MTLLLLQVTAVACFASLVYGGIIESVVESNDINQTLKAKDRSELCPLTNSGTSIYVAHPTDCSLFYMCEDGIPHLKKCQSGLHFSMKLKTCHYPETAGCDKDAGKEPKDKIIDDEFRVCPATNSRFPVYLPHPEDCSKFYMCDSGKAYLKECFSGLHFNPKTKTCDYPDNARCETGDVGDVKKPKGKFIDEDSNLCPVQNSKFPVYLPHPDDCTKFYICDSGTPHLKVCQRGLHFNPKVKACDFPENAGCDTDAVVKPKGRITDDDSGLCPNKNSKFPMYLPHPDDCTKFYICDSGTPHLKVCQRGLHFNQKIKACDYPENAGCSDGSYDKREGRIANEDQYDSCPTTNKGRPVFMPHPTECEKFFICNGERKFPFTCQPGLHFNPEQEACDYPKNVKCGENVPVKPKGKSLDDSFSVSCPDENPPDKPILRSHPTDCDKFFVCDHGKPVLQRCQSGLYFNEEIQACDYEENTVCNKQMTDVFAGEQSPFCPPRNGYIPVFFRHPTDCNVYYMCGNGLAYKFFCPARLHFNLRLKVCDYEENANCQRVYF